MGERSQYAKSIYPSKSSGSKDLDNKSTAAHNNSKVSA
jgi:hypothetical protein